MPIKKFEQWLVSQNLNPKQFILPIDRLLNKLGYTGKPTVYLSLNRIAIYTTLYWLIAFPLFSTVIFSLILRDLMWLGAVKQAATQEPVLIPVLVGGSMLFGLSMAYLIKKNTKKVSLPKWETFTN